jgi:hypothetical protein
MDSSAKTLGDRDKMGDLEIGDRDILGEIAALGESSARDVVPAIALGDLEVRGDGATTVVSPCSRLRIPGKGSTNDRP